MNRVTRDDPRVPLSEPSARNASFSPSVLDPEPATGGSGAKEPPRTAVAAPTVPPTLIVTLDGHPPGENVLRRWHWTKRAVSHRAWRTATRYLALQAMTKGYLFPWRKATIRVVWGSKANRVRDLGNILGAVKPCIDGLVDAGMLVDDSDRVVVGLSAVTEPARADFVRLEVTPA